MEMFSKRYP